MLHEKRVSRWASSRVRLFAVFCGFFLLLGASSPVVAQQKRDAETTKKVLKLIRDGNQQYDDEKYEAAFESYTQAYELYPDPAILVRLGKTAEKLGENRAAIKYYNEFIDANPNDDTAKQLAKRVPELKKGLPPLIKVTSTPDGASVYLGEASEENLIGKTPTDVEANAGDVTIVVQKEGYEAVERKLELEPGGTTELPVELKASESQAVADSDAEQDEPDEGAALVEEPVDRASERQTRADTTDLSVWGYGTAGVGVALLGTGAVFAALSQGAENDVNSYNKRAPGASREDLQDLKDQSESYYNTSVGLFVAGGVLTATGAGILTYHFLSDDEGQESAVRLNGGVGPSGGWVGLSGRF